MKLYKVTKRHEFTVEYTVVAEDEDAAIIKARRLHPYIDGDEQSSREEIVAVEEARGGQNS